MGYKGVIGVGKESVEGQAVAPAFFFPFNSHTFGKQIDRAEATGMNGSRGKSQTRSQQTLNKSGGGFVYEGVKATELPIFIEMSHGAWSGGTSYFGSGTLTETLPTYTFVVWDGVERHTYAGCKAGKITFASSKGSQLLKVTMENIVALTGVPTSDPLIPTSYVSDGKPLVHCRSTLKIDTVSTPVDDFQFTLENVLDADEFFNSQDRQAVPEEDRNVSGSVTLPYNSTTYAAALAKFYSGAVAAITQEWTDGSYTAKLIMNTVYFTGQTPGIDGRKAVMLTAPFEARDSADGANDAVSYVGSAV
jgi:hypothetical protein